MTLRSEFVREAAASAWLGIVIFVDIFVNKKLSIRYLLAI
jgi:hypothetical protein